MSASATPTPAAGGRFFTGFTRLCKGLAVILFLVHILVHLFPSAATYLTLIPARTIPFAWNLVTAGYIEQTIPGVIVSIFGLLLFGKVLEPLWGAKELLKFIFIVNLSTSACVFVTTIVLYYITQEESYLYTPVSGFYGVLSGLLVGIKQILPDQELNLLVLKISAKWIPSVVAFISVAVSFFIKESMSYLPIILFGIYMSWIYLRYFQRRLEVGLKGQIWTLLLLYSTNFSVDDLQDLKAQGSRHWMGHGSLVQAPLRQTGGEKGVRGHWSRDWQRSWPRSGTRRARLRRSSSSSVRTRRMMLLIKSEPSCSQLVEFAVRGDPCVRFFLVFLRVPSRERDPQYSGVAAHGMAIVTEECNRVRRQMRHACSNQFLQDSE